MSLTNEYHNGAMGLHAVYSEPPCVDESQPICKTIESGMCAFPGGSASITNIELFRGSFNFEQAEVCEILNSVPSLATGANGVRTPSWTLCSP